MHQRYRRQTDDRRQTDGSAIAYSEREREFTSAKNWQIKEGMFPTWRAESIYRPTIQYIEWEWPCDVISNSFLSMPASDHHVLGKRNANTFSRVSLISLFGNIALSFSLINPLIQLHLNNVANLHKLTSRSTSCPATWRSYLDHRLLWRQFTPLYTIECNAPCAMQWQYDKKNSSGDEIANVNFLRRYGTYVLQNTKKREPTSFNQLDDS